MKVCFGIDLGTSNSSIAYVSAGGRRRDLSVQEVHEIRIDSGDGLAESTRLPSVVAQIKEPGSTPRRGTGWVVLRWAQSMLRKQPKDPPRVGRDILRSFKSDMGTNRVYHGSRIDGVSTPREAATALLEELILAASERLDGMDVRECPVVITVPASFSELARRETHEAAERAGLEHLSFIDEPVAALVDCLNDAKGDAWLGDGEPKNILVFDYGGGTCDLSLVCAQLEEGSTTGVRVTNLAISNYLRLGGDDVDRAVMQQVVWPQILNRSKVLDSVEDLDFGERLRVERLLTLTVAKILKERMCNLLSRRSPDEEDEWLLEAPKERVVTTDMKHPVRVGDESLRAFDFRMTEGQFRELMQPFVSDPDLEADDSSSKSLLRPIKEVLEKSGLDPSDLHFLVLHGGGTKNPLVVECLKEYLEDSAEFTEVQVVTTPDRDTSVARGAALECFFRHERGHHYVRPIMPETLGVLAKDDRPVPVVLAGTPVPYPEEGVETVDEAFYLQRNNQRELLIPLFVGTPDRLGAVVQMKDLPPDLRAGTEVRLRYRIDEDKRTSWWVSVAGGESWAAQLEVTPWSRTATTVARRDLDDFRRQMRQKHDLGRHATAEERKYEISLLSMAATQPEEYEELEASISEFVEQHGLSAELCNDLARMCASQGRLEDAIRWGRTAVEKAPDNLTLLGNLGMYLVESHQYREALPYLRQAAARTSYVYGRLLDALAALGLTDEMVATAEEGVEIARREAMRDPRSKSSWYTVERLSRILGRHDEARAARRRLQRLLLDERLNGDSRNQIASEDSGFFYETIEPGESEEEGSEEE